MRDLSYALRFSFYQTREESVAHAHEVQSFGARSETSEADFAGVQSRSDFFDVHFAERTFHQRADHQPDHLVEEAVAVELDRDARAFLADANGIDCADLARFGFPAIGGKTREVMSADEMFCCRFQNLQIERLRDVPGTATLERRQDRPAPDPVAINFSFCRTTRVKILRHISTAKHPDGGRQ